MNGKWLFWEYFCCAPVPSEGMNVDGGINTTENEAKKGEREEDFKTESLVSVEDAGGIEEERQVKLDDGSIATPRKLHDDGKGNEVETVSDHSQGYTIRRQTTISGEWWHSTASWWSVSYG